MARQYVTKKDAIIAEKALVNELLAQNYYGDEMDAGSWHWVKVVNLEPIRQEFSNGYSYLSYGDTCGCGSSDYSKGGVIQVRGKTEDGRVLYEYAAHGSPKGTQCPSGVLFFPK